MIQGLHTPLILDTGPLLIHAFHTFAGGRFLRHVSADIPASDQEGVGNLLTQALQTRTLTTPLVLSEFQSLAKARASFSDDYFIQFLQFYSLQLQVIELQSSDMKELLRSKQRFNSWRLSFTDTSLLMATNVTRGSLISLDGALVKLGKDCGLPTFHLYYDLYLGQP